MYNSRIKNRKLKRFIQKLLTITKFKTFSFSTPKKIILLSIILGILSLFLPWIIIQQEDKTSILLWLNNITIFSNIVICIIFLILIYLLFSFSSKEKIKILSQLEIKNSHLITTLYFIIILLSINSIFIINWLKIFYSNINFWKWIIILLISWIIWFITSFYINSKNNEKIIISDTDSKSNIYDNEKNMKLPI